MNPYYNRPSRRGIIRHFEEVDRATDRPIILYNIPQRTGSDMSNDLLAELAQLEHVVGVKQSNPANLAKIDGLRIYAGNDDLLADVLDLGEPEGSSSPPTCSARRCGGWSMSPSAGGRSTRAFRTSTGIWRVAPLACSTKAALNLLGPRGRARRGCRTSSSTSARLAVIRAMLERHGLLQTAHA